MGRELLANMQHLGIDTGGVQCDPERPTGRVLVHFEHASHRFEILPNQAYDHIQADAIHGAMHDIQPSIAYFGTLAQRNPASRLALDTFLNGAKCSRFLDLNLRPTWYDVQTIGHSLSKADIVKLNDEELKIIAELFHYPAASGRAYGRKLIQEFALDCLLVTCAAQGAWALLKDGTEIQVPGQNPENGLVDTVGAGDGFSAVCILALLEKWPAKTMLTRANAFAAALCGLRGAAPEKIEYYQPFIEDWQ